MVRWAKGGERKTPAVAGHPPPGVARPPLVPGWWSMASGPRAGNCQRGTSPGLRLPCESRPRYPPGVAPGQAPRALKPLACHGQAGSASPARPRRRARGHDGPSLPTLAHGHPASARRRRRSVSRRHRGTSLPRCLRRHCGAGPASRSSSLPITSRRATPTATGRARPRSTPPCDRRQGLSGRGGEPAEPGAGGRARRRSPGALRGSPGPPPA